MSGGCNKAFLAGMRGVATQIAYLRNNVIASQPQIAGNVPGQRLVNMQAGNTGIEAWAAPANRNLFSNAFTAWWLPNVANAPCTIHLGVVGGDIFLTPTLTGCILEINGNAITHHDGGSHSRAAAALLPLGGPGVVGHRRWDNDGIPPGFYASAVVGVRINGAWEFYQQSYDYNQINGGILPAAQVTAI